jgi:hypothetical protein
MKTKQLILAGCALMALSVGAAQAGPCDTGGRSTNLRDAGAGPTLGSAGQTTGISSANTNQHPPTDTINRATGDVATVPGCSETDARPAHSRPAGPGRQTVCDGGSRVLSRL